MVSVNKLQSVFRRRFLPGNLQPPEILWFCDLREAAQVLASWSIMHASFEQVESACIFGNGVTSSGGSGIWREGGARGF